MTNICFLHSLKKKKKSEKEKNTGQYLKKKSLHFLTNKIVCLEEVITCASERRKKCWQKSWCWSSTLPSTCCWWTQCWAFVRRSPWRPSSHCQLRSPSRGLQPLLQFLCCKGWCSAEGAGIGMAEVKLVCPLCELCCHPSRKQWRLQTGAAGLPAAPWSRRWLFCGGGKATMPTESWIASLFLVPDDFFNCCLHRFIWTYRRILPLCREVGGTGVFNSAHATCRPEQSSQERAGQEGSCHFQQL